MSAEKDPIRLVDASDDDMVRDLLEAGRGELGSAEQMRGVETRLAPLLGGGAPSGGGVAKSGLGFLAKLLGVIGGVAVFGGAAIHVARSPNVSREIPESPAALRAPELPSSSASISAPETTASVARASEVHAPPPRASAPKPVASIEKPNPGSEAKLLQDAHRAVASDPARALAMCNEHGKSFPRGVLGQEREVIAIEALTRLNRRAEAEARAKRFAQANRGSIHVRRLETILGKAL